MPIYGGCVVRIADRGLLQQSLVTANSPPPGANSPALWGDIVSKCGASNFRTSSFSEVGEPIVRLGYHIMSDDDIAFAIVTDEKTTRRTAHLALDEVAKLFRKMFVEPPAKLTATSCDVFRAPFVQLMVKYSDENNVDDKIKKVKQTVEEVKGLALDNVERVLQRGQQIDEIISATDDLQTQAQGFQRSSRQLRSQMWWSNMKAKFIIGGAVALFLLVVFFVFCGGVSCTTTKSSTTTS